MTIVSQRACVQKCVRESERACVCSWLYACIRASIYASVREASLTIRMKRIMKMTRLNHLSFWSEDCRFHSQDYGISTMGVW
jgi:hypothetical protein